MWTVFILVCFFLLSQLLFMRKREYGSKWETSHCSIDSKTQPLGSATLTICAAAWSKKNRTNTFPKNFSRIFKPNPVKPKNSLYIFLNGFFTYLDFFSLQNFVLSFLFTRLFLSFWPVFVVFSLILASVLWKKFTFSESLYLFHLGSCPGVALFCQLFTSFFSHLMCAIRN